MSDIPRQLSDVATSLNAGRRVNRRKVLEVLGWYGAKRKGRAIVARIENDFKELGLQTDPEFASADAGEKITFRLLGENSQNVVTVQTVTPDELVEDVEAKLYQADDEADDDDEQGDAPLTDESRVERQIADWTIDVLRTKDESGDLILQPAYQREFVWKPELSSRLVESILLNIPIPPLYFGETADGKLEVIDGQQRLKSLVDFISNKFKLVRLKSMPTLNGKFFRDLPKPQQNQILRTPIRTISIDVSTNDNLRFEIFERLNQGAVKLNQQELRNCVYRGKFNDLLRSLQADPSWRKVKGGNRPDERFVEQEMILRLFALSDRIDAYRGGLKRFLNDYMSNHGPKTDEAIFQKAEAFRTTMRNVLSVFGEQGAAKLYTIDQKTNEGRWERKFSIAALEIQTSALMGLSQNKIMNFSEQIRDQYIRLLLTDEELKESISKATGGGTATRIRWTKFKSIVRSVLDKVDEQPRLFLYELREKLYAKSKKCALCGNEIHSLSDATVDHILPFSLGGATVESNAQLAHRYCNAKKNANPDLVK